MKKLTYFDGCKTKDEATKRLKTLSKQYHPDTEGGNSEIMTEINEEYAVLKQKFKKNRELMVKKLEVFDWVRNKGLSGIENNHQSIKNATKEGVTEILKNIIPDEKKTLRKIAIGLIIEEIDDFDLIEFSQKMFEKAEKILKLNK